MYLIQRHLIHFPKFRSMRREADHDESAQTIGFQPNSLPGRSRDDDRAQHEHGQAGGLWDNTSADLRYCEVVGRCEHNLVKWSCA